MSRCLEVCLIPSPEIIRIQAGIDADFGRMPCNGRRMLRTAHAALLARIGLRFGAGDGATTFNRPDPHGRTPFGLDAGAGRPGPSVSGATSAAVFVPDDW